MNYTNLYEAIAPKVYIATTLAVLVFGGAWLVRKPRRISLYTTRRVRRVLVSALELYVFSVVLMLLGLMLYGGESGQFVQALILTGAVSCCVGAIVLPYAASHGRGTVRTSGSGRGWVIAAFSLAGIVWSIGSISLISRLITIDILQESFVAQITSMPLMVYAGFCAFALLSAIMEEVLFRGGLQSMLERTPLGNWGAILLTSLLFAMGHVGYIQPHGIKELQIFGLSVILGFAKVRYGLGAAIAIHVANNLFAVLTELLVVR